MLVQTWARRGIGVLCVVLAQPVAAASQDVEALARELAALREEVRQLREEVARLRPAAPPSATEPSPAPPPQDQAPQLPPPLSPPPAVPAAETVSSAELDLVRQQLAELARVKVESASRMSVRLFGTLLAHAFANSGEANWLDLPNIVPPRAQADHTGSFSLGMRQSRVGLLVDGPALGDVRTSATALVDFFGGIPGFQTGQVMPIPRLLVGFVRMETERTALQVGQDHVVLAPRDPTSLAAFAFPSLFRSGNLYLRAPQVRLERDLGRGVTGTIALSAPVGGDLAGEDYRFVPQPLGGERSRRPAVQGRVAFSSAHDEDVTRFASVAASGHGGTERRSATSASSWAAAVDFAARRDWVGVAGELFSGDNIDAFGGGTGLDRRASGGWAELQVFPSARLSFVAGGGLDRLRPRRRPSRGIAIAAPTAARS
jgi:hypothetical protein